MFVPVSSPSTEELKGLVQRIAERIGRSLERSGLIERDIDNAYLAIDPAEEAPNHGLLGYSITYRIATGPREGQKVFTLQTLPAEPDAPRPDVAESSGFSLHAGIAAKASRRDKVERLARYVSRPPVATERLSLTRGGNVRYALTNRQDCRFARPQAARRAGHRDVSGEHTVSRRHHARDVAPGILPSALRASLRLSKIAPGDFVEPEDFIARLVALVPKPRAHLTRYHGVFAPASPDRAKIVPRTRTVAERGEAAATDRQRAMSWAQRLKRVFAIDIDKSAGSPSPVLNHSGHCAGTGGCWLAP